MSERPRLPRSATVPSVARIAVSIAALISAGCVTEKVEDAPAAAAAQPVDSPAGKPPAAPEDPAAATARDLEFGRTLFALDKRVDEYVLLGSVPGEEARSRRTTAETALEAVVAQYVDPLLTAAAAQDDDARRRVATKSLAFSTDARATAPLVAALKSKDATTQTNAAFALARRRDPETPIPALLTAARAVDVDVRVNALLALWHVLDARAEAKRPIDPAVREEILPVLETALFDADDPMARGHAAAAMGALGDPRGVDPLLNLLRDAHPVVRTHTALALGKLGDRRAIRPLVDLIDETPAGTPKGAVLLGISLLLEHEGIAVPADLPEIERNWSEFVQRALPANR